MKVQPIGDTETWPNPLGLDGIRFIEVCGSSEKYYGDLFAQIGMQNLASDETGQIKAHKQGEALLIENRSPSKFAAQFAKLHGPCVSALGFGVADADLAFKTALGAGAKALPLSDQEKLFDAPVLEGIGGSALYLIQLDHEAELYERVFDHDLTASSPKGIGFFDIDHITHNVVQGNLGAWVDFYISIFGFRPVFKVDKDNRLGKLTSMSTVAVMSPCQRFRIAVNEPTESKSQIQQFIDELGGEGVQHIALSSHDLYVSMESISQTDFPFQSTPEAYYDIVEERMPDHGEDFERLKRLRILLDGDNIGTDENPKWSSLLQIFSKNVVGPAFFEFIQRKGNDGFGDRNAQALFESIEREQQRAGFLPNQ